MVETSPPRIPTVTECDPEPNYRVLGLLITLGMGSLLFCFGFVVQIVVYWLRDFAISQGVELPTISDWFFRCFGLRPSCHTLAVLFWPWWLLLAAYFQSLVRYPDPPQFARVFGYQLIAWVMLTLCLIGVGAICAFMPFVILLAALESAPEYMKIVPIVSWMLPLIVVGLIAYWSMNYLRIERTADGNLRIVSRGSPLAQPPSNDSPRG